MSTYILNNEHVVGNCMRAVADAGSDSVLHEVIIREVKQGKTLKQLGAHFGLWVKHIANLNGESEDEVHSMLKAKFLARIYFIEPIGLEQENWVELCAIYQASGDQAALKKKAKEISLSWASLNQMKEFMTAVENHFISKGQPLPVIDKHYRGDWRK